MTTIPPRPIADLNVPLHRLEADLEAFLALKQARTAAGVAAEARHQLDPGEARMDRAFAALACDHPEACATDDTYPDFHPGGGA